MSDSNNEEKHWSEKEAIEITSLIEDVHFGEDLTCPHTTFIANGLIVTDPDPDSNRESTAVLGIMRRDDSVFLSLEREKAIKLMYVLSGIFNLTLHDLLRGATNSENDI